MTTHMHSVANSFSADMGDAGPLSDAFRPAHAPSTYRARVVIGKTSAVGFHGAFSWRALASLGGAAPVRQGIDHVATIPEAVIALGEIGLPQTAKRVAELDSICREDPDESDVDLGSLKRLVHVMQANPDWGEPSLALAGEKNCIHAEWPVRGGGRVTLSFLPSGRVDYTASSAPVTDDDALDIAGHHLEGEAIQNIRWFTNRIVAR